MIADKIVSLSRLEALLAQDRKSGETIVACSGSFDLLTAKHALLLERFKQEGDRLVVLLNSDRSIRSYKGPRRPIVLEEERAFLLASLGCVDYVCLFDEINPLAVLEKLKPNVYANGGDWGTGFLERDVVRGYGGRIYVAKRQTMTSTSDIVSRVQSLRDTPDVRAVFLDRDGVVIKDKRYLHRVEEVELMPGIISTLRRLQRLGYLLIIATNQSGIGRKLFTRTATDRVNSYLQTLLKKHGIILSDIFVCPHSPDKRCNCRKPAPGLLLMAAKKYGIALARSYLIGDAPRDIAAGKWVNCKTILLTSGPLPKNSLESPHFVIKKLSEVQRIIRE
ncbi:HAD-IIIA family hydrolase [Patescibacteria group bacterium]|nr:HAD-IIIA family hydrolase [Patescibacteria group bacterium]